MTIEPQEYKQTDKSEEIRYNRHFKPVLNIQQSGEAEAHLHADKIAGKGHCGEGQLHSEPDGDAHENLVGGKDGGLPGESERSGLPDYASKEASDDEGKGNLRTCWNGDRTEGRGGRK